MPYHLPMRQEIKGAQGRISGNSSLARLSCLYPLLAPMGHQQHAAILPGCRSCPQKSYSERGVRPEQCKTAWPYSLLELGCCPRQPHSSPDLATRPIVQAPCYVNAEVCPRRTARDTRINYRVHEHVVLEEGKRRTYNPQPNNISIGEVYIAGTERLVGSGKPSRDAAGRVTIGVNNVTRKLCRAQPHRWPGSAYARPSIS